MKYFFVLIFLFYSSLSVCADGLFEKIISRRDSYSSKMNLHIKYKSYTESELLEEIAKYVNGYLEIIKGHNNKLLQIDCDSIISNGLKIDLLKNDIEASKADQIRVSMAWYIAILPKLSPLELALKNKYPEIADKVIYLGYLATKKAKQYYPMNKQYLAEGDAFRHAYWNALLVKYFGSSFALAWTSAHEIRFKDEGYGPFNKSDTDTTMDMLNNSIGRVIGQKNIEKSDEEIESIIKSEIAKGSLYRLNNKEERIIVRTGIE